MAARSALETERENILAEAQTPHEVGLDGALKSYVNGRADAYNNIRNALAESSAVELPKLIEPEEINVAPPTLAIDDRQQSLSLAFVRNTHEPRSNSTTISALPLGCRPRRGSCGLGNDVFRSAAHADLGEGLLG